MTDGCFSNLSPGSFRKIVGGLFTIFQRFVMIEIYFRCLKTANILKINFLRILFEKKICLFTIELMGELNRFFWPIFLIEERYHKENNHNVRNFFGLKKLIQILPTF